MDGSVSFVAPDGKYQVSRIRRAERPPQNAPMQHLLRHASCHAVVRRRGKFEQQPCVPTRTSSGTSVPTCVGLTAARRFASRRKFERNRLEWSLRCVRVPGRLPACSPRTRSKSPHPSAASSPSRSRSAIHSMRASVSSATVAERSLPRLVILLPFRIRRSDAGRRPHRRADALPRAARNRHLRAHLLAAPRR